MSLFLRHNYLPEGMLNGQVNTSVDVILLIKTCKQAWTQRKNRRHVRRLTSFFFIKWHILETLFFVSKSFYSCKNCINWSNISLIETVDVISSIVNSANFELQASSQRRIKSNISLAWSLIASKQDTLTRHWVIATAASRF